jgi:hypothetical protein
MLDFEMLCRIQKFVHVFLIVTEVCPSVNTFLAVWRILHLRIELFFLKIA